MRRAAMTAALAVLAGLVTAVGVAPTAVAGVSPGQTVRVSVRSDLTEPAEPSYNPSISGDGRYVVFSSRDHLDTSAPVPDTANSQIYLRDLVANTTRLLTFNYGFPENGDPVVALPANGTSEFPSISADGRYVAFQTTAPLAFPDDIHKIVLIDRDPDGDTILDEPVGNTISLTYTMLSGEGDFALPAYTPSISVSDENGIVVVFEVQSDGTEPPLAVARATPTDSPGVYDVAREAVSPLQAGLDLYHAWSPAISADGERVVAQADYTTPDPEPVPFLFDPAPTAPASAGTAVAGMAAAAQVGPEPGERVVAFDLDAVDEGGGVPALRLDIDPEGLETAHRGGNRPQISGDGRKVVFEMSVDVCTSPSCEFPLWRTRAFIADPDPDGNGTIDSAPVVDTLSRDNTGAIVRGIMPTISADGRYAAFVTDDPNTHNGVNWPLGSSSCAVPRFPPIPFAAVAQTESTCQIVVRDLVHDKQRLDADLSRLPGELATPSAFLDCSDDLQPGDTCASDGIATMPALAGDGGVVAFLSDAADLVSGDDNGQVDVYARRFTPNVQAEPIDFGGVQLGDAANSGTVVTPVGFGPLVIDTVAVSGTDFTLDDHTCGVAMYTGDTCAVTVDFAPSADGPRSGTVDITPRFVGPVKIPISGLGTPFPQPDPAFVAGPDPLDFGQRLTLTDSAPGVVTVTNAGERPLVIGAVSLPPLPAPSAPGDYTITANTCAGATLAAGATCTVTLVHQPKAPGARPAVLQFDQLVPGGAIQPHLVELLGAGTAPSIQVNPAVVPVGRITTVLGTGFPPERVISIRLPGFPEVVSVTTNPDGSFDQLLLVYPNSVPGSRVVEVTVDESPTIGDTTNLLVVPGSLGPPDFLVRR